MSKIIPSIYSIDRAKVARLLSDKQEYKASEVHGLISGNHHDIRKRGETSAKPYTLLDTQQVGEYQIAIYTTPSDFIPHSWANLFPESLEVNVLYPNLAAFLSRGDECYAISSGMGHTLFEQFIDIDFPLDIARRIMNPRMSSTVERDITGSVYGRQQQFRNSQLIISSQSLGTVWQGIKGEVSEDVRNSAAFINIFDPDRPKVAVEAGSALTIRRSIDIMQFPKLLEWLKKLRTQKPTPQQIEAFKFLDGLKEFSARKSKSTLEQLKLQLAATVRKGLSAKNLDLDFSHKDFAAYQSAVAYSIDDPKCPDNWDSPPTAMEVFLELDEAGLIDTSSDETMLKSMEKVRFTTQGSTPQDNRTASIINYLHGEFKNGTNSVFLIDGRYYAAQESFLSRVDDDFVALQTSEFYAGDSDLQLLPYKSAGQSEGAYNDSYVDKEGWIVGDRMLLSNVELADLIQINGDKVFFVHNKIGFGASTRDVCSQILLSMQILNQVKLSSDRGLLEDYYDTIKRLKHKGRDLKITKDAFVDKILLTKTSDITYVLGYATPQPAKVTSQSSIAKFETIKLCNFDSKPFGFALKVVHTKRG